MTASKNNTEGNINGTRRTIKKKISYNKYNQFLISAVKGATKDFLIYLQYERSVYKHFCITSHVIHSNSPVLTGSHLHLWNSDCIYIFLLNLSHLGYSSEILPHLLLLLSFHVTTLFLHAHAIYIHPKCLKKGRFGKSISRRSKTSVKYCFCPFL